MALKPISFVNNLAYPVVVYDSSNPDNPTDAEKTYLGELVQLGTVAANSSGDIVPLQPGSAFVIENASIFKPVKRCTVPAINHITSFTVAQEDEAKMAASLKFVDFIMHNKTDALSKNFNAVLTGQHDDLETAVNNFFLQNADYKICDYPTYMMAVAYVALNPESIAKPPEEATYSLSKLVEGLGGTWPAGFPDITVSHFTCAIKDNNLDLKVNIDISNMPFENDATKESIKSLFVDTTIKAELTVNLSLGLGIFSARLSLNFENFKIPVGGSNNINITSPTITLDVNPLFKFVVFTIKGTLPFNMFNSPFDADLSITIDNEEAHVGVVIAGDKVSFPAPPVLKGVHLDEVGVGMGIFFKPPAFALGLETKFHIGEPNGGNVIELNDDTFALICKIESEIPEPVFFSFYVPKMDVKEVVTIFTDSTPNIDVPVTFSELSFRWSENFMDAYVLPDGSLTNGGYGFSATANIFSFGFYGFVEIDLNSGLTADIEMSPLNWGNVFTMSGDGKGVSIKIDQNGNPIRNNQISVTKAMQEALKTATDKQIVTPGGPVLIINTLKSPFLHLNAKVSLFDLIDFSIEADINKNGINFLLDYGAVLKEKMSVVLADFHNLSASFTYYINRTITVPTIAGVKLGSFHLAADVETHFKITTSLSDIKLSTGGSFNFEGLRRSFGDFEADIHISKITDFLEAIGRYIEQEAKNIFSEFLNDAQKWASKVKAGFFTAYDEVGSVLKNVWNADSVKVAAVMREAGYAASEIASNIKNAWNCGLNDVTWAMKQVGYSAAEVAGAVQSAFNAVAQDVTNSLKWLGYAANDVGNVIKNIFGGDSVGVAKVMRAAGYAAEEVANAIKNAWNCGLNDVTWAMQQVGYGAEEVAGAVKTAFNAAVQDVTNSFKWLGYAANDVGNVIKNIFGGDSIAVASVMKAAEYTADEVGGAIKNAWNCGTTDVAYAMRAVGYTADEVGSTLKNTFNASINDVAGAMKAVGYTADEVGNTLKNTFNAGINDVAGALKTVGYTADQVGSTLKNVFNTSVDAVADAMKSVGYAADQVKNAFDDLGGDFKDYASKVWDKINPSHWF